MKFYLLKYKQILLLREKKQLEKSYQMRQKASQYWIFGLISLSLLVVILATRNYISSRKFKKLYDSLIHDINSQEMSIAASEIITSKDIGEEKENLELDEIEILQIPKKLHTISNEVIQDILHKLDIFEERKHFLQPNLTQSKVAKKFKTNTTYLSIIINQEKQKSFVNYINALRIAGGSLGAGPRLIMEASGNRSVSVPLSFVDASPSAIDSATSARSLGRVRVDVSGLDRMI